MFVEFQVFFDQILTANMLKNILAFRHNLQEQNQDVTPPPKHRHVKHAFFLLDWRQNASFSEQTTHVLIYYYLLFINSVTGNQLIMGADRTGLELETLGARV